MGIDVFFPTTAKCFSSSTLVKLVEDMIQVSAQGPHTIANGKHESKRWHKK